MTVPTATSVPARSRRARATSSGRTQTEATPYSAANRHPSSMARSSSSGRRREWSMVLAISRSLKSATDRVMGHLAGGCAELGRRRRPPRRPSPRAPEWSFHERPQDIPGNEEAALDQLVAPFERPVLVFDDAVALVAGPVEGGEDPRPVDLPQ